MKIASLPKLLLLAVALSLFASACKNPKKGTTPIFPAGPTKAPSDNNPSPMENPNPGPRMQRDSSPGFSNIPPTSEGIPPADRGRYDNYIHDREMFKQDTVFFAFDKYNVKPDELSKIQAVATYLKNQPSEAVLVEGHCDERGTPEYNRALGERRALSVRESLVSLGISADRVQTVSFGEDKPVDPGHNEAAWSKNRRGEFVLLKPK